MGGGEGPSPAPEQIIIDESFKNNECIMEVYTKLGGSKLVENYLKLFENVLKAPNLTWKIGNIEASHGMTDRISHYNYEITLNENQLDYPLEVASTILHELIHATLMRWYESSATPSDMKNNFPGIWDYYQRYGLGNYQHQLMANVYIEKMIEALKEFDNSYDDSYYEALAWSGLEGTINYNRLSSNKIKQIETAMKKFYSDGKNKKNCEI